MPPAGASVARAEIPDPPRRTADLLGQERAEAELLVAWRRHRLSHAWLIAGPRGIGKATLAFRFARFVLAQGDGDGDKAGSAGLFAAEPGGDGLALPPSHPVFQRVASGGHADLVTIERQVNDKTGRLRSEILVEDVRRLNGFFAKSAAEGGWRIAIVDSVDEMSRSAANALLKILEEPPPRSLLLLIAHAPGNVLATLRSRCRRLACRPLPPSLVREVLGARAPDLEPEEREELVRLAEGSPGQALSLAAQGGISAYHELLALVESLPAIDSASLHAYAERLARAEKEAEFHLALDLLQRLIARIVRAGASSAPADGTAAESEARLIARLGGGIGPGAALDRWLDVWEKVGRLRERAEAVNLDRKQVLLTIFFALARAAQA